MTAPTRRELQRAVTRWCAEYGQDPAEVLVQVQDGGWRSFEALARLVGEEIAARPARAIGPEADVRRSRGPFPDTDAFRRLEQIARGAYAGEATDDSRPATAIRQRWTPGDWLLIGLLVFGEVFLVACVVWLLFGGAR